MLKEQPVVNALLINLLMGAMWHYISFLLCISLDKSFFNADKRMYRPHKWENGGKFYSDYVKINRWKDFMPQHIGKDGFSKDHLDDVSIEYLDEFIMETCRGEWNHTVNSFFVIILFMVNTLWIALVLSVLLFILNVPCLVIQRYNRFRLQKVRATLVRKIEREQRRNLKALSANE